MAEVISIEAEIGGATVKSGIPILLIDNMNKKMGEYIRL